MLSNKLLSEGVEDRFICVRRTSGPRFMLPHSISQHFSKLTSIETAAFIFDASRTSADGPKDCNYMSLSTVC